MDTFVVFSLWSSKRGWPETCLQDLSPCKQEEGTDQGLAFAFECTGGESGKQRLCRPHELLRDSPHLPRNLQHLPPMQEQSHPKKRSGNRTLVAGHYCHDRIRLSSGNEVEALGGSVSYITNVLDALGLQCTVVSKVGSDFSYASAISHPPSVVDGARTTQFFADFTNGSDRVLRVPVACEPILPSDIPSHHPTGYAVGLAAGVAREILPETLRRMVEVSNLVVVDAQALIRTIHPADGTVALRALAETDFYELLDQISFLKASSLESPYVDIEEARRRTCVLVTEGDNGCRVFQRDREFHVPAFPAEEVDPTGAGDSFLAGFSAGLIMGLPVEDAVLAGNFFGSVTVGQIGVPRFTEEHLQRLQHALDKRIKNGICSSMQIYADFSEPRVMEEPGIQGINSPEHISDSSLP